jgi:hypothetical protein
MTSSGLMPGCGLRERATWLSSAILEDACAPQQQWSRILAAQAQGEGAAAALESRSLRAAQDEEYEAALAADRERAAARIAEAAAREAAEHRRGRTRAVADVVEWFGAGAVCLDTPLKL